VVLRRPALPEIDCLQAGVQGHVVLVNASAHAAALCEKGKRVAIFSVRLGRNGVDKRWEGDGRTPLGRYPLGAPQPSLQYGTFIPVGYPTEAQRRDGYTGSAIGVHGPDRRVRWAGRWANAFDTTSGCIGVATDAEMTKIAEFVRRAPVAEIIVFDEPDANLAPGVDGARALR
jgi:murein L,D-transpeptidase YafK